MFLMRSLSLLRVLLSDLPGQLVNVTCSLFRVSNTPGNLLEISKVSWKFSGLVLKVVHLSLILVTILVFQSVSVLNVSR